MPRINDQRIDSQRQGCVQNFRRDQPIVDLGPAGAAIGAAIRASRRPGIQDRRSLWIDGHRHDNVHFFHADHPLIPQTPGIPALEDTDGRGCIDRFTVTGIKGELIDDRHVFLQAGVIWHPVLAAIRAFVYGIKHGAGIDGRGAFRIDGQREYAVRAQIRRHPFPGSSPVARFVDRLIRGDVQDARVRRMECNGYDGIARAAATAADRQKERCRHDHQNRTTHNAISRPHVFSSAGSGLIGLSQTALHSRSVLHSLAP